MLFVVGDNFCFFVIFRWFIILSVRFYFLFVKVLMVIEMYVKVVLYVFLLINLVLLDFYFIYDFNREKVMIEELYL